jgi:hypothetical protein
MSFGKQQPGKLKENGIILGWIKGSIMDGQ